MSVDLSKYGQEIKAACSEVTSEKNETDWAMFGYEGQSNVLKLVCTGDGGLDELTEDFNPSKIQYAFLKVEDQKTSLPKFVLINWQGESAPGTRKGTCSMHIRDIETFLAGHHVTISVRNEDELDIKMILDKVSKVSASAYNFKEKPQGMEHSPGPVGTAHKKINPMAELPDMNTREKFWQQDQEQEKVRVIAERERREVEQKKAESERLKREEKERSVRDEIVKERERKISNLRESEASTETGDKDRARWEEQRREDQVDEAERRNRGEVMKQNRAKEAKELLAGRGSEAKKVFQRNSSQGQMNFGLGQLVRKPSSTGGGGVRANGGTTEAAAPPVKPSPPAPVIVSEATPCVTSEDAPGQDDIAPPPPAFDSSPVKTEEEPSSVGLHRASPAKVDVQEDKVEEEVTEEDAEIAETNTANTNMESYGTCAVALYDYEAADETEISFDPGQIISHIDQIDPGWWQGLGPDGNYGLFPANYVDIIDNKELQVM